MSQSPGHYPPSGQYPSPGQYPWPGYAGGVPPRPQGPLPRDPSWKAVLWFCAALLLAPALLVSGGMLLLGILFLMLGHGSLSMFGDVLSAGADLFVDTLPMLLPPCLVLIGNRALRGPWWAGALVSIPVFLAATVAASLIWKDVRTPWATEITRIAEWFLMPGAPLVILVLVLGPLFLARSARRRRARAMMTPGAPVQQYPGQQYPGQQYPGQQYPGPGSQANPGGPPRR